MIQIKHFSVSTEQKHILNNINLTVQSGQVCALMGPNGSGKSTLAHAIMGHPSYEVTGSIFFDGKDITELTVDKRARLGIFLSFQNPIAIPGVTVFTFLYEAYQAVTQNKCSVREFKELLQQKMAILKTDFSFAQRALNDGFSGGEKKRFELLQLLILKPKLAILDEIDSGLDVDALQMVANGINQARKENPCMSILLITHYQRILQYIVPDVVHVLQDGSISNSGNASLAQKIDKHGYKDSYPSTSSGRTVRDAARV